MKAKEDTINCLQEAKIQTDEELKKAMEKEQISATDMEKLENRLQEIEQIARSLEKQKKLLENEWNSQKVQTINFRYFLNTTNSNFLLQRSTTSSSIGWSKMHMIELTDEFHKLLTLQNGQW